MPPVAQLHTEDTLKRVRVLFNGKFIVDTTKAKLVWEKPYYPTYFFAKSDLPSSTLRESEGVQHEQDVKVHDIVVDNRVAKGAVTEFTDNGLFRITFGAVDAWFEEDERIYVHPKDPYKRIDVLQSSRHVRVEVGGVEVSNTHRPWFLFETGLRRRTYIPLTDVRLDLLRPSQTTTECPYKGVANYFDVILHDQDIYKDLVWYYRAPLVEAVQIAGLVAFLDEKVDIWVDGEKQN